jgi:hypothetical protein
MHTSSVDPKMEKLYQKYESQVLSYYEQKRNAQTQFNSSYDKRHPPPETPASVKQYLEQQKKEYEQWVKQQHKAAEKQQDAKTQFIVSYDKEHPRPKLPPNVKEYFEDFNQQMYSFSVDPKMEILYQKYERQVHSYEEQRVQAIKQFNSSYDTQHPLLETPASVKQYLEQEQREWEQERMKREHETIKWDEIDRVVQILRGEQEQWYY